MALTLRLHFWGPNLDRVDRALSFKYSPYPNWFATSTAYGHLVQDFTVGRSAMVQSRLQIWDQLQEEHRDL
jgi:hypothetical protein